MELTAKQFFPLPVREDINFYKSFRHLTPEEVYYILPVLMTWAD